MRKTLLLILILTPLLFACSLPRIIPSPIPGSGSDTPGNQPCYFNWATQALPELSAQVQAAMQAAGLANVSAAAGAYGENCYDARTNQPVRFAAMETDFFVTVRMKNLTNQAEMGNLLEQILIVLDGFPTGMTPGPQSGYIRVTFQTAADELRLWFPVTDGEAARAQGLHGAALLEKLQKR
jgi:hypothetical protein